MTELQQNLDRFEGSCKERLLALQAEPNPAQLYSLQLAVVGLDRHRLAAAWDHEEIAAEAVRLLDHPAQALKLLRPSLTDLPRLPDDPDQAAASLAEEFAHNLLGQRPDLGPRARPA